MWSNKSKLTVKSLVATRLVKSGLPSFCTVHLDGSIALCAVLTTDRQLFIRLQVPAKSMWQRPLAILTGGAGFSADICLTMGLIRSLSRYGESAYASPAKNSHMEWLGWHQLWMRSGKLAFSSKWLGHLLCELLIAHLLNFCWSGQTGSN